MYLLLCGVCCGVVYADVRCMGYLDATVVLGVLSFLRVCSRSRVEVRCKKKDDIDVGTKLSHWCLVVLWFLCSADRCASCQEVCCGRVWWSAAVEGAGVSGRCKQL